MHPQLKLAAARHALHLATADDLIDAAHAALDDGFYTYSLGELVTQAEPSHGESHRLFQAAVQELGIVVPGRDECISILTEDAVTGIMEGAESSPSVIRRLYGDSLSLGHPDTLRDWVSHQYKLEDFEAVTWGDEPPAGQDTLVWDALLANILQHARKWGRKRWRPLILPDWRTSTVIGLAAAIREEKAFDRLPILADALQEAGCENEDVLAHLRFPGKHVHCCWVAELLLGPTA